MSGLGWRGALAVLLIVPAGVACATAVVLAHVLEPRWNMGGLTFVLGYPKTVELTAVLAGIGAGAASALLARWRWAWAVAWAAALGGFAAVWWLWQPRPLPWLPGVAVAALLALGLARAARAPAPPPVAEGAAPATLAWAALLTALAGLCATGSLPVDVYHSGSALLSALDLTRGGRPFHSFIWAHGLQDTGVTALWIQLTGKVGSSPLALMDATTGAQAVAALTLVARGVLGSWRGALAAAALGIGTVVALGLPPFGVVGVITMLRAIGHLLWLAAAFAAADAAPRGRYALAGALVAIAHLFRFELGMHGLLAIGAVIVYRAAFADPRPGLAAAAAATAVALARFALGLGGALLACRLLVGWPDGAWYANTFGFLATYHTAYNGYPFPWPRGTAVGWAREHLRAGLVLAVGLVLLAAGARAALAARWPAAGDPPAGLADRHRTALLIFAALLAAAGLRTALDRSDPSHLVMWIYVPLFAAALLVGDRAWHRLLATPARQAAVLATVALALAWRVVAVGAPARLVEHLRPNPPQGPCGDTFYTASEAAGSYTWSLIEDTCMTEQLLRAHGVAHLLTDHSAPWYHARFDLPLPSEHYMLNQAAPPAEQLQLIERWRRLPLQALLQVRGYLALERYDVHNAFQAPVLEAYLRGRRAGARQVATPIGRLSLFDRPPGPPPAAPAGAADPALDVRVNEVVVDPATGFVVVQGWAADTATHGAVPRFTLLRDGVVDAAAEQVTPLPRPDVAAFFADPRHALAGWMLVTRVAAPGALPALRVRAETADGRHAEIDVPAALQRVLPARHGDEWHALPAAVARAEALGRADAAAGRPH